MLRRIAPRIDIKRSASVWSPRPHGDPHASQHRTIYRHRRTAGSKGVVRCSSSRRFASPPSYAHVAVSRSASPRPVRRGAAGRHDHQGESGQDQRARRRRRSVVRESRHGDEDRPVQEDSAAEALPGGHREVLGAGEAERRPDARRLRRRPAVPAGRHERSMGGDEADVQLRAHALLHRRPRAASLRRRHRPAAGRSGRPAALQRRAPLRARLAARAAVHRPPAHRSEARDPAQQGRRLPQSRSLSRARALRPEGHRRPQLPLPRSAPAGRPLALPAEPPPRAPSLERAAFRGALRPGHRRRQLRRLRRPDSVVHLEVPRQEADAGVAPRREHAARALQERRRHDVLRGVGDARPRC